MLSSERVRELYNPFSFPLSPQGRRNKPPSFKHFTHSWLMFRAAVILNLLDDVGENPQLKSNFNLYTFPSDDEVTEKNMGCGIPCSLQLCLACPAPTVCSRAPPRLDTWPHVPTELHHPMHRRSNRISQQHTGVSMITPGNSFSIGAFTKKW